VSLIITHINNDDDDDDDDDDGDGRKVMAMAFQNDLPS